MEKNSQQTKINNISLEVDHDHTTILSIPLNLANLT